MLKEGLLDPKGNLFYEKLEEVNGVSGDRNIIIAEGAGRSPSNEEAREARFLLEIERWKGGLMGIYAKYE